MLAAWGGRSWAPGGGGDRCGVGLGPGPAASSPEGQESQPWSPACRCGQSQGQLAPPGARAGHQRHLPLRLLPQLPRGLLSSSLFTSPCSWSVPPVRAGGHAQGRWTWAVPSPRALLLIPQNPAGMPHVHRRRWGQGGRVQIANSLSGLVSRAVPALSRAVPPTLRGGPAVFPIHG